MPRAQGCAGAAMYRMYGQEKGVHRYVGARQRLEARSLPLGVQAVEQPYLRLLKMRDNLVPH